MRSALEGIRQHIEARSYTNEEHIRLCIVCRILNELGWDIWNPQEVNTEFVCNPDEDRTKVDIALFAPSGEPDVFIEIKALGQLRGRLSDIERQLRDYNRNNTAMFSIITDGEEWRFYYSQTGGEFSKKCFKVLNLQRDPTEELEASFGALLSRSAIRSGSAVQQATDYLRLTQRQRVMEEFLPEARRKLLVPPFPSLPQALADLVLEQGTEVSIEEAAAFISDYQERKPVPIQPQVVPIPPPPTVSQFRPASSGSSNPQPVRQLDPSNPGDLRFTKIVFGRIGHNQATGWTELVKAGIKLALDKGVSVQDLQRRLTVNISTDPRAEQGFRWDPSLRLSIQGLSAKAAADNLHKLAVFLGEELFIKFFWRQHPEAKYPGEDGQIHWTP